MSLARRIAASMGPGSLRRSALGLRDGEYTFRHFLDGKGYKTALEIGTYRGMSAACMSQYVDQVITIDLSHGQLEQAGKPFDREAFWESLGIENIRLVLVADNDDKRRLIASLDFDFAFIDGAHDETVRDDFDMVKKCGAVLFHDYAYRPGKPNHVKRFVDTLGPVEVRDVFAFWKR